MSADPEVMFRIKDQVFKALQRHFPKTCFCVSADKNIIFIEWDSGPQVSEIRALTAPILGDRIRLCTDRWEPCLVCRTYDGTRGDEDILLCPNGWRVL
jgi:hypothetical protein